MQYKGLRAVVHLLLFVTLITLVNSCEHKIEEESLTWQPYKAGDELVFESESGTIQTVSILEIRKRTSDVDPLSILPKKQEIITIIGKSLFEDDQASSKLEKFDLLDLSAHSGASQYLWFHWSTSRARLYGNNVIELKQLKRKALQKFDSPFGEIDVYVFESTDTTFTGRKNFINKFYWNKDLGYVRFELGKGENWTLINKLRN